jgi:hypothetical protein
MDDWPWLAPCCWLREIDPETGEEVFVLVDDEDEDEEFETLH